MPQVFDNIDQSLLPALQSALSLSDNAETATIHKLKTGGINGQSR